MIASNKISLKLTNNTPIPIPTGVLGGNQSPYASADNKVVVEWDLTGFDFEQSNSVVLELPTPIEKQLGSPNIGSLVAACNTMGVGIFSHQGSILYCTSLLNENIKTADIKIYNTNELSADTTLFTADTTQLTADQTVI